MWHASVSYRGRFDPPVGERERRATLALRGVGDADLGQWVMATPVAAHMRRRLSDAEVERSGLVVRDIRRTTEANDRYIALPRQVQALIPPIVYADEIGPF